MGDNVRMWFRGILLKIESDLSSKLQVWYLNFLYTGNLVWKNSYMPQKVNIESLCSIKWSLELEADFWSMGCYTVFDNINVFAVWEHATLVRCFKLWGCFLSFALIDVSRQRCEPSWSNLTRKDKRNFADNACLTLASIIWKTTYAMWD